MRTIRLPRASGEGKIITRIVHAPYTLERIRIIGPSALAKDNDYRQGAVLTELRDAWEARALGWAGLYAEAVTAEMRDLGIVTGEER